MDIWEFLIAVLGGVIVTAFIIYKVREKSPRFRIVETQHSGYGIISSHGTISNYSPQVKINGNWFYIAKKPEDSVELNAIYPYHFFDPQDAIKLIDKFKSAGNYTIPSNEKLKSNQKAIIVE